MPEGRKEGKEEKVSGTILGTKYIKIITSIVPTIETLHTLYRKTHMLAAVAERELLGWWQGAQTDEVEQGKLRKPRRGLGRFGGCGRKGPSSCSVHSRQTRDERVIK